MTNHTPSPSGQRTLWATVMALIAVFTGAGGALLASGAGAPVPTAVLTGGGAFGGTLLLLLAVAHYLEGRTP